MVITHSVVFSASGIFDRAVIVQGGSFSFLSGSAFDTTNFGEFTSGSIFLLTGGQLKTYKNGTDNITGAAMYYRIYKQGISPLPSFDTIVLPWKSDATSPLGSIDQTWERTGLTTNILNGLIDGNYIIEVYYEAFYTDQSGANIHIDNNGGNNYTASFSINNCSLNLGENKKFCSAFNMTLSAGQGFTDYLWSTGDTISTVVVSQPGTYKVTITNASCIAVDSITIYSGTSSFTLNIGNDTTVCGLGVVTLNTGGLFTSYHWSTGDTVSEIQVNTAGMYTVTVSTTDNCLLMDERQINFKGLPLVDIGSNTSICIGDSVKLDAGNGFMTYLWSDNSHTQSITIYNSGTYSVSVTDSSGCSGFDVVIVNSYQKAEAGFNYAQGTGLEINFTDLSQNSAQNYWDFFGINNFIADSVGNVSYTYPFAGTYTVKMIASNNCSSDTTEMTINVIASMEELLINDKILIYPNPTKDFLYLELKGNININQIILRDLQNRLLQQIEIKELNISQGQTYQLNIPSSKGIYFINIITDNAIYNKKIIIE